MKLYRATTDQTDSETIPSGSCWTPERATAVAYQDNQGFGGAHIVEIETTDSVLDVRGRGCRDLTKLAAALEMDAQDWCDSGYDSVYAVIENSRPARVALANLGVAWLCYHDDYPVNATTWKRL
jgi:hypothetical protein